MIYYLAFCLVIDTAVTLLFWHLFDGTAALLILAVMLLQTVASMLRVAR